MHEFQLRLTVAPLAFASFCLRALALSQIKHEGNTVVLLFVERGRADQHRHATAVLAHVLLFIRLDRPGRVHSLQGADGACAPFRRRQVGQSQVARGDILSVVSHHLEECVVGLDDFTLPTRDENPNDVSVDQTLDFRLALRHVTVQPGVLQRDCRL